MPHVGAVFAAIAGVMAIMLHSSIHKIEEGHLAVYYRYHDTDTESPCLIEITHEYKNVDGILLFVGLFPDNDNAWKCKCILRRVCFKPV